MSPASSSAGAWPTRLERPSPPADLPRRPDDPRLGHAVEFWSGDPAALRPGRAVIVGFPQDEGVRRNGGRPGAAAAPREVRTWLYRLSPSDPAAGADLARLDLLDLGDVPTTADLEGAQQALGAVVGAVLKSGSVPVVLGGGHETAFGHYLGYVEAGLPVAVLNLDAHLDVRPLLDGRGHSGSPFRQALEHDPPLAGRHYACLGAQPFNTGAAHWEYARAKGCSVGWRDDVDGRLSQFFHRELERFRAEARLIYVTLDADCVGSAEVPGVSAPNPLGLSGAEVLTCLREAGASPGVASLDVVEINPLTDPTGRSARWAALAVWQFLAGLAMRPNRL